MTNTGDLSSSGKRKLFSLLCHGSIFLGSLLVTSAIPFVILLLFDDPSYQGNCQRNTQLSLQYLAVWGDLGRIRLPIYCFDYHDSFSLGDWHRLFPVSPSATNFLGF